MSNPATETLSVVIEREMPFPPEKIWRALTQPHLIAEWLMKNDFKPVVEFQRGLGRCRLPGSGRRTEQNTVLHLGGLRSRECCHLDSRFRRYGDSLTHGAVGLPRRSAAGLPGRQVRVAEVLCEPGAGIGAGGLKSVGTIRLGAQSYGDPIEYEHADSATAPLAVHCLYGDRHRQFRRPGIWGTAALGGLFAVGAAVLAAVQRPLHVRTALCCGAAQ